VLAVVGDGGIHYALGELATMGQTGARVTLLIVDDGAYGILREYQQESFGATFATSLRQPAWRDLATAFGLPVRVSTRVDLAEDLRAEGPNVVVLPAQLVSAGPTP
jgi:acetolactate synthase-1/2/3 large subunit